MLDERDEPRDLFDVWFALTQAAVPFEALTLGHRARFGYDPISAFLTRAERLRHVWNERLGHQRRELPEFDVVLGDVRAIVDNREFS